MRRSASLFLLIVAALPALASAHKSEAWVRTQFETAEKIRASLNAQATGDRSTHDYQKVIDAYRRVYFGAPSSSKADPSVMAVAELQCEMGRHFGDKAILRKAILQYEFLRREYPGSKDRAQALFAIGEIYRDDLGEPARAKNAFEELVEHYPHNHLADQARQALTAPQSAEAKRKEEKETASQTSPHGNAGGGADTNEPASHSLSQDFASLPLISGIHHSSMAGFTRVVIDFEKGRSVAGGAPVGSRSQDVRFVSQYLSHPDRIYFDLADTKPSRKLNGKSFDVDDPLLKKIRVAQFTQGRTRVVLEVEEKSVYQATWSADPPRLLIDIRKDDVRKDVRQSEVGKKANENPGALEKSASETEAELPTSRNLPVTIAPVEAPKPFIGPVAVTAGPAVKKTVVGADGDDADASTAELASAGRPPVTAAAERSQIRPARSVHEAQPTANGDRSLIRALGLKIGKIVIDPGHGGHDTGTIGPNGLTEKDLVLDVSLRLGKLLESRLGAEVDYTRADDTFIPLETRTAIANQDQADLFVSVHANSSHDPDARGVETYYLNFTTSRDALEVAARENAVSDQSIYELQDLVKKIALKEKIEESREFASDVQTALHSGLAAKNPGLRDRGVRRAPFIVLIGANMPSILAEISFVSNPGDERKLKTPEYRQRIAESLYRGVAKYVSGLSGVRVASKIDKSSGQ